MKFFKYHFLFLLWLVIIFVESSISSTEYPKIEIWSADKILHIGVFGLLTVLCYISLIHQRKYPLLLKHALIISLIFASLYGLSDEFHQYFVPNRDCDFWDWLADAAGAVLGILLIKYILAGKFRLFNGFEYSADKKT